MSFSTLILGNNLLMGGEARLLAHSFVTASSLGSNPDMPQKIKNGRHRQSRGRHTLARHNFLISVQGHQRRCKTRVPAALSPRRRRERSNSCRSSSSSCRSSSSSCRSSSSSCRSSSSSCRGNLFPTCYFVIFL